MAQDPVGETPTVPNRGDNVFSEASRADDRPGCVRNSALESGQGDCGLHHGVRLKRVTRTLCRDCLNKFKKSKKNYQLLPHGHNCVPTPFWDITSMVCLAWANQQSCPCFWDPKSEHVEISLKKMIQVCQNPKNPGEEGVVKCCECM